MGLHMIRKDHIVAATTGVKVAVAVTVQDERVVARPTEQFHARSAWDEVGRAADDERVVRSIATRVAVAVQADRGQRVFIGVSRAFLNGQPNVTFNGFAPTSSDGRFESERLPPGARIQI